MTWNAAIVISYSFPLVGREAKAMEVFAAGLTSFGSLAADGKCAEPEVFHHLVGGGMIIVKTESVEIAYDILEMDDVRRILDTAVFAVGDFDLEVMVTGKKLMENMSLYTAVGVELGYI
ncbi:MAG TPA: hypothetical protein VFD97_01555 [Acidimicrobiia bacterium]|nr:hypothetical protein [Acidimicrobiia bacterium]